jgi:hypothetical protein
LWAVVPIWLYWISRTWLLAHRGTMNEDPVLFALTALLTFARDPNPSATKATDPQAPKG